MTHWSVVEAEYAPEGRDYEQLFTDADSEAFDRLNEVYGERLFNDTSFENAADQVPRAETRNFNLLRPSAKTDDGYTWRGEILKINSRVREYFKPITDNKEIAVLFPEKTLVENEDIEKDSTEVSAEEWLQEAKGFGEKYQEAFFEGFSSNPDSVTPIPERSIGVYATQNVDDAEAEEFLWELADALEEETGDKRYGEEQ